MTSATLNPNSTVSEGGGELEANPGIYPGYEMHDALADAVDETYVVLKGNHTGIGFPTPSMPSGARVAAIIARTRLATKPDDLGNIGHVLRNNVPDIPGTQDIQVTSQAPLTTLTYVSGDADKNGAVNDWELDLKNQFGVGLELRIFKLQLIVTYVARPVVTVTAPTGTITNTSFPLTTWTVVSDPDAGPLDKAEVKIFSAAQYGAIGFSPDGSTPFAESGLLDKSASDQDVVRNWRTTVKLPNATYQAYVRTRSDPESNWSNWAFSQFTVNVVPPADPTSVTATPESALGRMKIVVDGSDSPRTVDAVEIERATALGESAQTVNDTFTDADGTALSAHTGELGANWTPKTPGSGKIASNRWHPDGAHRQLYASAVPTSPYYSVFGIVRRVTGLTNGNAGVMGRVAASEDTGYEAYWGTGGTVWTLAKRVNNTVTTLGTYADDPGNGVNRTVELRMAGTSIKVLIDGTERISVTDAAIPAAGRPGIRGNTGAATTGIHLDSVWVEGIPYGDWESVRPFGDDYMGISPVAGDATAWDWEAPNGRLVRYRARALHAYALGEWATSDWVQSSPASWSSRRWWLKHPTDWTRNIEVELYSLPTVSRSARQTTFEIPGRTDPVVVSDKVRGPANGTLSLIEINGDQDALDELLDTQRPLLLQGTSSSDWPDRWVRLGDQERTRTVDKEWAQGALGAYPWVEVARPKGNLESTPIVAGVPPSQGHLRIPFTFPDAFR